MLLKTGVMVTLSQRDEPKTTKKAKNGFFGHLDMSETCFRPHPTTFFQLNIVVYSYKNALYLAQTPAVVRRLSVKMVASQLGHLLACDS